jgi:hypothetical protein
MRDPATQRASKALEGAARGVTLRFPCAAFFSTFRRSESVTGPLKGSYMDLPEHLSLTASRSYRPIPVWLRPDGEWMGGAILRELNTPVGMAVFDTYRDLMLWLLLAPPHRSRAFGVDAYELRTVELDGVAVPQELAPSLGTLYEIYRGARSVARM